MAAPPTRANATTFDDFFSAFGKSVRADVELQDNEIVVTHSGSLLNEALAAALPVHPQSNSRPGSRAHAQLPRLRDKQQAPSRLVPNTTQDKSNTRIDTLLPPHIDALVRLQLPDGSWRFDDKFSYSINGVATPPPEGISPKLWATAIAVTVCRQSPEYFEQLESTYEKAMLHVDDNILRLAKTHLDLTAVEQVSTECICLVQ